MGIPQRHATSKKSAHLPNPVSRGFLPSRVFVNFRSERRLFVGFGVSSSRVSKLRASVDGPDNWERSNEAFTVDA